jgi:flagellar FliL protein
MDLSFAPVWHSHCFFSGKSPILGEVMAKADEKGEKPEASAEQPKPKGKKKIILLALVGLLLTLGGLGAYIFLGDEPPVGKEAQASPQISKDRVFMTLEPFLVNLADKETRRYLKLKVELEVENEKALKELEKSLPRLRDSIIMLLSSKTYLDLASVEGKQQLKQELKKRVTALPGGNKVGDLFFTEFVAQ